MVMIEDDRTRCPWPGRDPLYVAYHDQEWGVPERDDRALYEKLVLDSFQAGLAWITVLRKRENFRRAFAGFNPEVVAAYGPDDVAGLMADPGIIRNRAKIEAAIADARAWLRIMEAEGSFAAFLWGIVGNERRINHWGTPSETPVETPQSRAMSMALRERGFRFVGPTICYAFMQAVGMVNDHLVDCFRHRELS